LTVPSVDQTARTISFTPMAGYADPSTFNSGLANGGGDSFVGFIFRNGVPITQTGRMTVQTPITGSSLAFTGSDPWANSAAVAAIQSGDVFVYTDRAEDRTRFTSTIP
jgi:hypothetical protein